MRIIILIILIAVLACVPVDTPSESSDILNGNPSLSLGECNTRIFTTEQWGVETIQQCTPEGYTLYEQPLNDSPPIRINYTGAAYSILPHGGYGAIGFTQKVTLSEGCHVISIEGFIHFWGAIGDTWLSSTWQTDDMSNAVELGKYPIIANGDYRASFTFDTPAAHTYAINTYLWLQWPSTTADSYMTIDAITVEGCG